MNENRINLFNRNERPAAMDCGIFRILYLSYEKNLVNLYPAIANIDFQELIEFLEDWEGANTNDGFPDVW